MPDSAMPPPDLPLLPDETQGLGMLSISECTVFFSNFLGCCTIHHLACCSTFANNCLNQAVTSRYSKVL